MLLNSLVYISQSHVICLISLNFHGLIFFLSVTPRFCIDTQFTHPLQDIQTFNDFITANVFRTSRPGPEQVEGLNLFAAHKRLDRMSKKFS